MTKACRLNGWPGLLAPVKTLPPLDSGYLGQHRVGVDHHRSIHPVEQRQGVLGVGVKAQVTGGGITLGQPGLQPGDFAAPVVSPVNTPSSRAGSTAITCSMPSCLATGATRCRDEEEISSSRSPWR